MEPRIHIPIHEIEKFCERNSIRKLSLFGSVVRNDFTPDSDIDVLVEFESGQTPGFKFFSMGDELSSIFHRRIDFISRSAVERSKNQIRKSSILESETIIYEK